MMRILNNELALVCCYFNPCNYYSRFLNFVLFIESIKKYKINLVVVEAFSSSSKYRIHKLHDDVISINTKEVYWMKENLINIGIKFLLDFKFKNIGWVDCDIILNESNIVEKICEELETHRVVHIFSECTQWITDTTYKNKTSVCKLARKHTNLLTLLIHRMGDVGYGYVYNTNILRKVVLYDKAIVGTGDWLNLLGCIPIKNHNELMYDRFFSGATRGFFNSYVNWQTHMSREVGGRVGYVDAHIDILHHGNEQNRHYVNREDILKLHRFEPNQHLISHGNVYKLQNPGLETAIHEYFINRDEDNVISTTKTNLVNNKLKSFIFRDSHNKPLNITSTYEYINQIKNISTSEIVPTVYESGLAAPHTNNHTDTRAIVFSCHTNIKHKFEEESDITHIVFRKDGDIQKNDVISLSHKMSPTHTYLDYIIRNYLKLPTYIFFCNDIHRTSPINQTDIFNQCIDVGFTYIDLGGGHPTPTNEIKLTPYTIWQYELTGSTDMIHTPHSSSFIVNGCSITKHPIRFYKNLILKCDKYKYSGYELYFEKLWGNLFK